MSIVKDDSFSPISTQSNKDGIVFKNYHFGGYQSRLRPTFYRYIKLFDTTDKDDLDYQPNS